MLRKRKHYVWSAPREEVRACRGQAVGEQDREMDYVVDGKEVLANCDDVLVGEEGDECAVIEHAEARQIPKGEELYEHISPSTRCPLPARDQSFSEKQSRRCGRNARITCRLFLPRRGRDGVSAGEVKK